MGDIKRGARGDRNRTSNAWWQSR